MSSYGVSIFGHGHPALKEALARQLDRIISLHGSFSHPARSGAADALIARCGGGLARVSFSSSGTEANEAALKYAALASGRKRFIACRGGYHGKTLGALSATDGAKYRAAFEPLLWEFAFVPYDDTAALEAAIDERTAAFIVEPIQGESGIRPPRPGYLAEAFRICHDRGVLVILDEIQTGTGRTGRFLASQSEPLRYDIVTLGKGLAGGLPVGATLVSEAVARAVPRGAHTSTFGGNPLTAAGIQATLGLLDSAALARVSDLGSAAIERLRSLASPLVRDVRGAGLMLGLQVAPFPRRRPQSPPARENPGHPGGRRRRPLPSPLHHRTGAYRASGRNPAQDPPPARLRRPAMCRFLIVRSAEAFDPGPLFRAFAEMARLSRAPDGDRQADGWGAALQDPSGGWLSRKSLRPIWQDGEALDEIPAGRIFLLHARSASFSDQKEMLEFNQPFVEGRRAFVFNGLLKGVAFPRPLEGRIGAQKIWALIRGLLGREDPADSLRLLAG